MIVLGKKIVLLTSLSAVIALTANCSKKDDDDATTPVEEEKAALASADSMDDLKISGSLAISLPESLTGDSGASLTAGEKRSHEACEIGNTVKQVTNGLQAAAGFFCHLEVEKEKIKFGTKYRIMSGDEEFARIYVDNSKSANGEVTVYMCEKDSAGEMTLKEKIALTGISDDGARGSLFSKGSQETQSWESEVSFDANIAKAGVLTIEAKHVHADTEFDGQNKSHVVLTLAEKGVSTVSLVSDGEWQGNAFEHRGYAAFNGKHGNAIFNSVGSHMEGEETVEHSFTHRSWFNNEGYLVNPDDFDVFAPEGELYIAEDKLPEFLDESFDPEDPSGYDCSYDETVNLDPESSDHAACEKDRNHDRPECWGEEFEQGENAE
jgi:hypothetical protein